MASIVPHSLGSQRCSLFRWVHGVILGVWLVGVVSLQACRGGKFDYGVDSESTDGGDTAADDNEQVKELMEKQVTRTLEQLSR